MEHHVSEAFRERCSVRGSGHRQAEHERFLGKMASATTYAEMEEIVQDAVSEVGLMEFIRLDAGAVLAKGGVSGNPKSIRLIIGNPLIMQSMARLVPDAVSYAPVTVLIDQRPDGVHLTYDEMASLLAPKRKCGSSEDCAGFGREGKGLFQDAS